MRRKARSSVPSVKPEPGADFGPALRPDRTGRLVTWGGAAAVSVESRDDPTVSDRRRVVRGARRSDALAVLEARKVITKRMRDAAERFLDDCSIACGGSSCDNVGMPVGAGARSGLPERQVDAITRVNQVRRLLRLTAVFWAVLFQNVSLRAFEASQRWRHGEATERLRAALVTLDGHYHDAPVVRRHNPSQPHRTPQNLVGHARSLQRA